MYGGLTKSLKRIDKAFVLVETKVLDKIKAHRVVEVSSVPNKFLVKEIEMDEDT